MSGLVRPIVFGVTDNCSNFAVRQLLPSGHGQVVLTIEHDVDLLACISIQHDRCAIEGFDGAHAFAIGLVTGLAIGRVDLFAFLHEVSHGPNFVGVVLFGGQFFVLLSHPSGVLLGAHHFDVDGHVSMFFTAQLLALAVEVAGFFGTEPSVTHKTWNRILLDTKRVDRKRVDHVIRGGDDAHLLVDRNHQGVVDLEQIIVGGFGIAAVGHFTLGVVQGGDEANAFTFAFDVVVTPFPLVARGFDGQVGVGSVFARHHRFGCWQGHQDHDDERHHGPSDFNFQRLVKRGCFVSC